MPRVSAVRDERGFTLVEVLASVLVLAVGIFAGMQVLSSALGTQRAAERLDVGVTYGERLLEDLRSLPYAKVAVRSSGATPASDGADHPMARVTGGKLTTTDGAEDLVAFDATSPYRDYEVRSFGQRRFAIWRFVSWRDEECPVVDLAHLEDLLGDLRGLLTSTTGSLGTLLGPTGTLTATLTSSNGLLGGGLLGGLGLGALLSSVTQLTAVLNPLNTALSPLQSPLKGALTPLASLLDPVTGHLTGVLDLCDIPSGTLPSVADVSALNAVLTALDPLLATITTVTTHVGGIVSNLASLNLFGLLGAVVQAPAILVDVAKLVTAKSTLDGILGGVVDTLGNPTQLTTLATGLTTSLTKLAGFLAAPDTTHNTKRVTVAVQLLDGAGDHGPHKPVWLSTVVHDPEDGLL